jgi:predicted NBD/HSP70 family sugar kinase
MNLFRHKLESGKDLSRRLILDQICHHGHVSRSEMVEQTGLSKATISSIVAELIEAGLVQESGSQSPPVGRPRILLSLVPDAHFILGAELTDEECRIVLTNLHSQPLRQVILPVASADLSVEPLLQLLERAVAETTEGVDTSRILAMGVCVPGIVDPVAGSVAISVLLPWKNVPLGELLCRRFQYPITISSRGAAATWGERWFGAGRGVSNVLYVRMGGGIVGGLVIQGQPYLGHNFAAGELGHVTVQPEGALCRCGNRGCLATVATTTALLNRVRQLLREAPDNPLWAELEYDFEQLTLDQVIAAANGGNQLALQALSEVGRWLGIALASAINLLNLDMIIVGGPVAQAEDHLFGPLRAELVQRTLPTHLANLAIVPSALKENAPSTGMASLVLHYLTSPNGDRFLHFLAPVPQPR